MLLLIYSRVALSAMLFSLGVQPGDTPARTPIPDPDPPPAAEPEPVEKPWDWQPMTDTSIDMRPMFYPAKNQLFRGSCATFAVVGAMEFFPGVPKLSEAYLYSTLKADNLKIEGANLREMKEYLDANPIVAEEVMPYELVGVFAFDTQSADDVKIGRAFNEKKGRQARLVSDQAIYQARGVSVREGDEITWEWIERNLREGKPIVCGFRMNGDHWTKSGGWIHTNRYKTVLDELSLSDKMSAYEDDGGHAVLAVGYRTIYDPEGTGPVRERRLIHQICIRNSWGIQWGHQGYGWVSWETYGKDRLRQAMTIDRVETLTPTRLDRAPDLRLRWQGFKFKKDDYAVTLSCVIRSNYLPEGGISSVKYTIYSGADKMNEVFEKFPLGGQDLDRAGRRVHGELPRTVGQLAQREDGRDLCVGRNGGVLGPGAGTADVESGAGRRGADEALRHNRLQSDMRAVRGLLVVVCVVLISSMPTTHPRATREPIVGFLCEWCEATFDGFSAASGSTPTLV